MTILEAILIAIVEGITEFLPISSTGHMIIAQSLLGIESSDVFKAYIVNIQFGAILSVVALYWKRFFQSWEFYAKLFAACIPLVIAYLLEKQVDSMMESVLLVAVSLLVGGTILLFVDGWFRKNENAGEKKLSYKSAFLIGLFQIISIIPGVSRSAATIVGGMTQKLSRKQAAEFSFFLAVPTMFGASMLKLIENRQVIFSSNLDIFLIGNVVSFVVALIAIKTFISFLTKHGFKLFGYYRIAIGLLLIILLYFNVNLQVF